MYQMYFWNKRLHSHRKDKIKIFWMFHFKTSQNDQNDVVNQEKSLDHVEIMILWICERCNLDNFKRSCGFQSYQKILVNFKWLATLMPLFDWNIWSFELKLNKKILDKIRALSKHFCWPPFFMKDWVLWFRP